MTRIHVVTPDSETVYDVLSEARNVVRKALQQNNMVYFRPEHGVDSYAQVISPGDLRPEPMTVHIRPPMCGG